MRLLRECCYMEVVSSLTKNGVAHTQDTCSTTIAAIVRLGVCLASTPFRLTWLVKLDLRLRQTCVCGGCGCGCVHVHMHLILWCLIGQLNSQF